MKIEARIFFDTKQNNCHLLIFTNLICLYGEISGYMIFKKIIINQNMESLCYF